MLVDRIDPVEKKIQFAVLEEKPVPKRKKREAWCKILESTPPPLDSGRFLPVGTWLSLVEHSLGVRGVGSSNLPVPTNQHSLPQRGPSLRSGFRQRTPALLAPAKRLNLGCEGSAVQICPSRPTSGLPVMHDFVR